MTEFMVLSDDDRAAIVEQLKPDMVAMFSELICAKLQRLDINSRLPAGDPKSATEKKYWGEVKKAATLSEFKSIFAHYRWGLKGIIQESDFYTVIRDDF